MSTTLTQTETMIDREIAPAAPRHNPAVPRHLAISLGVEGRQRPPALSEATAALRALIEGCVERGVAVLTLLHPAESTDVFKHALIDLRSVIERATRAGLLLNLRAARDGRAELLEAVRRLSIQAAAGEVSPENIQSADIECALSTGDLPAVDLMISTGAGERLSGSLLWQCAYAELLFADVAWFEFTRVDFDSALADYAKRCRKFGGLA